MEILDNLLNQPIFYNLSSTLLHFIWQGLIIAFALHVFLKLVDEKRSELRYAGSLIAMSMNLLIPLFTFFIISKESAANSSSALSTTISENSLVASQVFAQNHFSWFDLTPLVSIAWMIGVIYFSMHLLFEMYKVYQLPRTAIVETDDHIQLMFNRLSTLLKVNQATRLVVSLKADVPMVIGWIRPVVLLPLSMASGLTTDQLEMLLTHELAHIKRNDYLVNFLQTLIEVVLFFHPCVKWVSQQVRAEREYCCDDIAVHQCGNAMAYATALTDAEMLRPHNIPQLAMAASGGNLKKRIYRVIEQQNCSPKHSGQWLASLFSFALVISLFTAGHVSGISSTENNTTALKVLNDVTAKAEPIIKDELEIDVIYNEELGKDPVIDIAVANDSITKKQLAKIPAIKSKLIKPKKPIKIASIESMNTKSSEAKAPAPKEQLSSIDTKIKILTPEVQTSALLPKQREISKAEEVPTRSLPKLIKQVAPAYPFKAINKQREGEFKVSFAVTTSGRVTDVVFENKTHKMFKRSIKKALRKWRFESGILNGEKTVMRISKSFVFSDPPNLHTASTGSRISPR